MSFELRYSGHLFHHLVQLARIKMHSVALELGPYVSGTLTVIGNYTLKDFISLAASIAALKHFMQRLAIIRVRQKTCHNPSLVASRIWRKALLLERIRATKLAFLLKLTSLVFL